MLFVCVVCLSHTARTKVGDDIVVEFAPSPIVMFVELVAWVERIGQNPLGPRVRVDIVAICAVVGGLGRGALFDDELSFASLQKPHVLVARQAVSGGPDPIFGGRVGLSGRGFAAGGSQLLALYSQGVFFCRGS